MIELVLPATSRRSPPAADRQFSERAGISSARLLTGVIELDLEHCPKCGGELVIIAAILERPVVEKILSHLGLQAQPPPHAPAREPMPLHAA